MDISSETGTTAGKVYSLLESQESREARLSEVKKQVGGRYVDYALGWLLRENKISIESRGKTSIVRLN
ncbi:MAG: hypothetical protein GF416_07760 [Candidatus Altiarchaeales archaeon]|nr:hypothetical protein [Candidatus Altiarchaeales archaeon]MBD3417008.1 hypothetical protein [Candidatus Altiarchaeales archaeon]